MDELWQYAQKAVAEEIDDSDASGFDKIEAEKVEQTIEKINEALQDKPVSRNKTAVEIYAKKNWLTTLESMNSRSLFTSIALAYMWVMRMKLCPNILIV